MLNLVGIVYGEVLHNHKISIYTPTKPLKITRLLEQK